MKKLLAIGACVLALVFFYSCAKDKANRPQSITCTGVNADSNTYTLKTKAIFDFYCGETPACHWNDAVNNIPFYTFNGNIRLDTYQDIVTTFHNKDVMCSIKHSSGCIAMPQGNPKLADSLITYIQCWSENGFPQ